MKNQQNRLQQCILMATAGGAGVIPQPSVAPDDELEDTIRRIQQSAEPIPAYQSRPLPFTMPDEKAPDTDALRLFGLGILTGLCWAGLAYLVLA